MYILRYDWINYWLAIQPFSLIENIIIKALRLHGFRPYILNNMTLWPISIIQKDGPFVVIYCNRYSLNLTLIIF